MLKVADLFAGVGGIALGFRNNGFNLSWANEIDKNACRTYCANFQHKLYECSIQDLNLDKLEKVDIITAGFPCQAFSIAGLQKGFDDDRGNLFFDIMQIVDKIHPLVIFLENVKNLENHDNGNTFRAIKEEIQKRGYFIKYKVMNTCKYSKLPQNRERIYILAFKDKMVYNNFQFPEEIKEKTEITDVLFKEVEEKYYYNNTKYYEDIKQMQKNKFYQWRRIYLRENKNNLCPTLTANMGTGGHNVPLIRDEKNVRKLTPRECFRLQGFSDDYILPDNLPNSALYKQAGNSVSVPVIESIVKRLKIAIENKGEKIIYQDNDMYKFIINGETYYENL